MRNARRLQLGPKARGAKFRSAPERLPLVARSLASNYHLTLAVHPPPQLLRHHGRPGFVRQDVLPLRVLGVQPIDDHRVAEQHRLFDHAAQSARAALPRARDVPHLLRIRTGVLGRSAQAARSCLGKSDRRHCQEHQCAAGAEGLDCRCGWMERCRLPRGRHQEGLGRDARWTRWVEGYPGRVGVAVAAAAGRRGLRRKSLSKELRTSTK